MSSVSQTKEQIRSTLKAISTRNFLEATKELLDVLGYRSDRILELSGSVDEFIQEFQTKNQNTQTEQAFREHVRSVRLVFQVTSEEIASADQPTLGFEADFFDKGQQLSFIFFAVELKGATYARGQYAQFTREINKRLSQPSVVLFRTAGHRLTLAFVHRRGHKRDDRRDVLGRVSLIREIDPADPHRAHLDILAELSLAECAKWIDAHDKERNFDGLLAAWLDKLDTEELNRRFYRELFAWFDRAVREARFPMDQARTLPTEEHVIRLITRLLFVWFMKEKKLVASGLFVERQIAGLLKNYDQDGGDSYYRAVLQNLFFATLNTEIDKRGFSKVRNVTHRNFSLYRYKREISDPDALLDLFAQTPFINGGLFDCLDSEEATGSGGYRVDCFSDNMIDLRRKEYGILSIPNRLFFDDAGLITLFNHYKFTVEENTPIEQEVALDPELLGKVFENLLAAYNPETRETARKQTGSYYTPRAVVDYMVEEALVATLAEKAQPDDGDAAYWRDRLRYLLDYEYAFDDANELFEEAEAEGIVQAIAEIKVLDPAVGSGAFPMGILHKLTLALQRIDPDNQRWQALQKERARQRADEAFETHDQQERDAELLEISETFERYSGDFGRKLYLIQNSIFGVDIQPVACQIAKLRFFISLAIEQEADKTADNFGIKPLPNLETRFVAANTLIGLGQHMLSSEKVQMLERELHTNRERHFHAANRQAKLKCLNEDRRLRGELAQELTQLGMPIAAANQVAQWDPYDQNAGADWFDTEYMFGVADGFDVVIGNPPYIQLQKNGGELGKLYKDTGYATFVRTGDIYQLFYECGCRLLRPAQGLLAYITSNSWLKAEYGKALRRYFSERHTPLRLLEMGKDIFENAIVDTSVLIVREGSGNATTCDAVDMDKLDATDFPPDASLWGQTRPDGEKPWSILSHAEHSVMDKMKARGTPLKGWDVAINYGIKTGYNEAFIIDDAVRQALIAEDSRSAEIIKPILRGRDIQRYRAKWAGLWLIDTHNGYGNVPAVNIDNYPAIKSRLDGFYPRLEKRQDKGRTSYNLRNCAYHAEFAKEKLFWMDLTEQGRFAYEEGEMFCVNTVYMVSGQSIKFLCAILNSNLINWFMRNTAVTSGMGVTRWFSISVETIPIPKIPAAEQRPFIRLVDSILSAKADDPAADTGEQEAEVDRLVYELYGLTEEEISTVEGKP